MGPKSLSRAYWCGFRVMDVSCAPFHAVAPIWRDLVRTPARGRFPRIAFSSGVPDSQTYHRQLVHPRRSRVDAGLLVRLCLQYASVTLKIEIPSASLLASP